MPFMLFPVLLPNLIVLVNDVLILQVFVFGGVDVAEDGEGLLVFGKGLGGVLEEVVGVALGFEVLGDGELDEVVLFAQLRVLLGEVQS